MSSIHRYAVLGRDHPALPTQLIGTYRTAVAARFVALGRWLGHILRGEWDAHAWVEDWGRPRRDLRYDPLAIGEDGPCPHGKARDRYCVLCPDEDWCPPSPDGDGPCP